MTTCAACRRRTALVAALSPWIDRGARRRRGGEGALLGRAEPELLDALGLDAPPALAGDADLLARERHHREHDGILAVCRHDPRYPARLEQLEDPPAVLHLRGAGERLLEDLAAGDRPVVAIVGARRAPDEGRRVADGLGEQLARAGVLVLSGMAYGVDAAAHGGALRATESGAGGAPATAAVLGGGVDRASPGGLHRLFGRLVAHGTVLAELPPGTQPRRWTFPARNRLIAALSDAVVVVSAATGSGSLITAELAQDLGRPVGAVPGSVLDDRQAGTNRLLRDGATPVLDLDDVAAMLGTELVLDRPGPAEDGALGDPVVAELAARLRRRARTLDELLAGEAAPAAVHAALSELEARGQVRRGLDGRLSWSGS
jgi:DNA processing protein